jgi:hypothetical protein
MPPPSFTVTVGLAPAILDRPEFADMVTGMETKIKLSKYLEDLERIHKPRTLPLESGM